MMKNHKYIALSLFLFLFVGSLQAQDLIRDRLEMDINEVSLAQATLNHPFVACNQAKQSEVILNQKKAYFKKHLALTEREAVLFWPLFDQFLEEEKDIHQNCKQNIEKEGIKRENGKINFDQLNHDQIIFYYDNKLKTKTQLLALELKYYEKWKDILTAQNLVQYYKIEKEFKNSISQELKFKN